MGYEVCALLETLVTLATAKGPLAGVHAPVVQQVGTQGEALAAVAAAKGLLASMDALMVSQVGAAAEALAALGAGERLLAGVHALVAHQVRRAAEALVALGTLVRLLAGVCALVASEIRAPAEALSALPAAMRLLLRQVLERAQARGRPPSPRPHWSAQGHSRLVLSPPGLSFPRAPGRGPCATCLAWQRLHLFQQGLLVLALELQTCNEGGVEAAPSVPVVSGARESWLRESTLALLGLSFLFYKMG